MIRTALLVLIGLFATALSAEAQTIQLKAEAQVPGDFICLADLIEQLSPSHEAFGLIRSVYLGSAPALGEETVISRERIMTEFRKRGVDCMVVGADAVRVRRGQDGWMAGLYPVLMKKLHDSIYAHALDTGERFEVEDVIVSIEDVTGLPGDFCDDRTESITVSSPPAFPERGIIEVEIVVALRADDDAEPETLGLTATVSVVSLQRIAILQRDYARGDELNADDFSYELRAVDHGDELVDPRILGAGVVARKALTAGSAVRLEDVDLPEVVKRGDVVQILIANPGFTIRSQGVAARDGALGDRIPVEMEGSTRKLIGRVVGRNQVEVVTGGAEEQK
jgi:flagella basal body P-ring formation protein FlgA